jgi:hypothetical protein
MNRTNFVLGVMGSELRKSEIKFLMEGVYFKCSSERKKLYDQHKIFRLRGDDYILNQWLVSDIVLS